MISYTITASEEGRHLLSYLKHVLPSAPESFWYKALRHNKIKVNRKKPSDLRQVLVQGDLLQLYLTDEQTVSFTLPSENAKKSTVPPKRSVSPDSLRIVFENDDLLIVDKPSGIAVQRGPEDPVSLTEIMRERLVRRGEVFSPGFTPSFCHRLDKNTAGLLIMAKNLKTSQEVSQALRERTIEKQYLAVAEGNAEKWRQETLLRYVMQRSEGERKTYMRKAEESDTQAVCETKVHLLKTGYLNTGANDLSIQRQKNNRSAFWSWNL